MKCCIIIVTFKIFEELKPLQNHVHCILKMSENLYSEYLQNIVVQILNNLRFPSIERFYYPLSLEIFIRFLMEISFTIWTLFVKVFLLNF